MRGSLLGALLDFQALHTHFYHIQKIKILPLQKAVRPECEKYKYIT
jgi:hypothetical protein